MSRYYASRTAVATEDASVGAEAFRVAFRPRATSLEEIKWSAIMIAVIFEITPAEGRASEYFSMAMQLKADVERMDGFISVERFESVTRPGKFVSLSFWRDEEAVRKWRAHGHHQMMQKAGRSGAFADYRLRVAAVMRDYGMTERAEAPADAVALHG